jgi:hypothetical protein
VRARPGFIAAGIGVGLAVAIAATASGATSGAAVLYRATANAPCTKPALTAGLHRGKQRGRIVGKSFGCAGRFAFAAVLVGAGKDEIEITVLFRAVARRWQVASRAKYCGDGAVPAKIRQPACETN